MSWSCLPIDIRCLILSERHTIRKDALKTIKKAWDKFRAPKIVAYEIISPYMNAEHEYTIPVMDLQIAQIMEFCVKVLSGKEAPSFWNAVLEVLTQELWMNEYSGGPGAKYKNSIEIAVEKLRSRFYV
jgi:hypothetical protein